MQINNKVTEILPDNEELLLQKLAAVIESVDELSHLQLEKMNNSYYIRVAPSIPSYNQIILAEVLKFFNLYGIHLDISKSIKTSGGTINFTISLK